MIKQQEIKSSGVKSVRIYLHQHSGPLASGYGMIVNQIIYIDFICFFG